MIKKYFLQERYLISNLLNNNLIDIEIPYNKKVLKLLKNTNINIYDIKYKKDNLIIKIDSSNYIKLKRLTPSKIIKTYGYNTLKLKFKNNIFELVSILIFITQTILISNIIVKINIITNNQELKESLLNQLNDYNIKEYSIKKNDKELNSIKKEILNTNKEKIEWLNIKKDGMTYIINMEEKVTKNKKEAKEYCNIVAKKEGTISKITTSKGTPLVEINEHVNAGDILISGTTEFNGEIKSLVCAEGKVYANTWYTINLSIPKKHKVKSKKDKYRYNLEIKNNNKRTTIFKSRINNPIKESKHLFNIFGYKIYIIKEYESQNIDKEYTEDEIKLKIDETIKEKLKPILKDDNKIIKQNVLKKVEFNSTIDIELFIVVEEEISTENYK